MIPPPSAAPATPSVDADAHALVDALDDALFLVDERWQVRWGNRAARELLATSPPGASGGAQLLGLFDSDTRLRIVLDAPPAPGAPPWCLPCVLPLAEGRPVVVTIGAAGASRFVRIADRSAEHALEERLADARAYEVVARQALALTDEFTELLTAITGAAEYMMEKLRAGDPLREDAAIIQRAADRAAVLTRELTTVATSRAPVPQLIDVARAVAATEPSLRRILGDRIDLHLAITPSLGSARVDVALLEGALQHLTRNAAEAMPVQGRLSIEADRFECAVPIPVAHGVLRPGTYARIAMRDTGRGMDDATLARCFEPLYSTTGGRGLGLSLVFGAITQLSGYVASASTAGGGTTMTLFLPLATAEGETVSRRSGGAPSVLLVDDEPMVRRVAARALRAEGYHVIEAADADEALSIVSGDPGVADVLITDVAMPGLNGVELAHCIVAARPDVRILFSSGLNILRDGTRVTLPRGAAFLPKPFTPRALGARLRELLESGG